MATVRRKMRQKCTPFAQKCTPNPCGGIRNANRSPKNALKMQTVRSKIVPREAWLRARGNICGAQIATVRTKMRQTCVPFGRNSMSNMQKWQPFIRKCVENAYPRAEMGVIDPPQTGQGVGFGGAILNPLSLLLLDFALPVANKLVLTFDRVRLFPCTCQAPCFLRARRAHCAYRRA